MPSHPDSHGLGSSVKYRDPPGHNPILVAAAVLAGPGGWVALGVGAALVVSYEYGFGSNATNNRETLTNAVENFVGSWQAQRQSQNPIHDALHELENPGYRDVVNLIRDEFNLGGR